MDEYSTAIALSTTASVNLDAPAVHAESELGRLPEAGKPFEVNVGNVYFVGKRDKRYLQYSYPGKNRADNHLQGVQRYGDYLYCTGADLTEHLAHLFVVKLQTDASGTPTGGTLEKIVAIDTKIPHPGGLQRLGDVLIIPLQGEKEDSQLVFVQVADPANPVLVDCIIHRPGRKNAGAAALTRLADGRLLAGGWSDNGPKLLDLYLSRDGDLRHGFLSAITCDLTNAVTPAPAYQSIAFFQPEQEAGGGVVVRMVGLRSTRQDVSNWIQGENVADLFELRIPALTLEKWPAGQVDARLVRSKAFTFGQFDGNFSAAAGLNVEADGRLTLYAAHHWRLDKELHFSACC